ncbi:hypothetical protein Golomagni_06407 [Golovinomyces magnicellulatus]|nr:hypothetical protein Golomagni_06407 [Golovinomyces magnicellulatus]
MTAENSPSKSSPQSKSQAAGEDGYVRLHITPLDSDLLKIVVPAAVLPNARNISFHTIETFPDRRYGFVELPTADADKLKKKLNGAVLKGSKMRVDKARPEKKVEIVEEDKASKKKRKSKEAENELEEAKKPKRDYGSIEGMTLHDRKVKRGWTEPLDYKKKNKKDKESKGKDKDLKRKQLKSKYTEKEECLFKAKLPANVASMTPKKEEAEEEEDSTKKRKKKKSSREVTVHEFENTTKFPSFLKNTAPAKTGKEAVEFVDGKGWVNANGDIVEAFKEKVKPKPAPKAKKVKIVEESSDDETSSSGSSSESDSSDEESEADSDDDMEDAPAPAEVPEPKPPKTQTQSELAAAKVKEAASKLDDDNSDSSPSASSDSSSESSDSDSDSDAETSSTPAKNLTITIPPPPTTPSAKAVHPLEALYKRNEATDAEAATPAAGFSFFGGGDDDVEEDSARSQTPAVPMTPFTRQDLEWRNVRSAAPTPDTAHPPRNQNFWANEEDDNADWQYADEDEVDEAYNNATAGNASSATSDFQKWFWENRGDLNRSWMTRRKTAAKEKRHRDNKARASRAV